MHTGFLNVKSQKMAKSLGNFITIKDALKKYSPETLRLFYISTHYRSPIDFNYESLKQVKSNLERINNFLIKGKTEFQPKTNKELILFLEEVIEVLNKDKNKIINFNIDE